MDNRTEHPQRAIVVGVDDSPEGAAAFEVAFAAAEQPAGPAPRRLPRPGGAGPAYRTHTMIAGG
jgi:hypothetical protein